MAGEKGGRDESEAAPRKETESALADDDALEK